MVDEHENVIIVHLLKMEARQAVGQSRVANCQDSHLPPPTPRNKITAIFFIHTRMHIIKENAPITHHIKLETTSKCIKPFIETDRNRHSGVAIDSKVITF